MRLRSLVLLALVILVVIGVLRRRAHSEFVDVDFADGSAIRLARSLEANDLLEDAHAILDRV